MAKEWLDEVIEKIESMPKEEFAALVKKALDDSGISYTEDDSGIDLASAFSFDSTLEETEKRKKGKWKSHLLDNGDLWANYCSECGTYLPYGLDWKPDFCPQCGAMMEEYEDEQN